MPTPKQLAGRKGGLKSWGNTVDRTKRTTPGTKASPASVDYWLARLDPVKFADATDAQRLAAAEAAWRAYFADLAYRSARSRSIKAKARARRKTEARPA